MIFSSWIYVLFLAITVMLYWKVPGKFRVPLLLIASYVFYMSWSPPFGLIYGPVIFLDSLYFYWLSLAMVRWPQWKKHIMIFGVTTELCLLGYFKYANFFGHTIHDIAQMAHLPVGAIEFNIFLPLAISFTNFILISYLVDIYRGNEVPDKSFVRFATYVAFFPHLIAGPIVRAKELLHQFDCCPKFAWENIAKGIHRFANGLFLKVFVADVIAVYVNTIFGAPELQAFNTSWVANYGFAVQIFCDFFGYTLMAQGSALMMGYTLPENFNAPYFAKNMSEFWQRWHISLSRWLKDYLYIPLGGNRGTKLQTYRNLFITMGLGGLWHGANWTFIVWGLYQGVLLCCYKIGKFLNINRFIPLPIAILLTFHTVCIARVFFRCQTISEAWSMLGTMFNPFHQLDISQNAANYVESGLTSMSTQTAFYIVILFFLMHGLIRLARPLMTWPVMKEAAIAVGYCVLLYFGVTLVGSQSQQFIYFQF
jgi:alginate O-acetyltransferase complex protein AlgI